jgi:hypothetical protein
MSATITCPSCHVTLKPKNPPVEGQSVRCPRCREVFAVPSATNASQPAEDEILDAEGVEENAEGRRTRNRSRGGMPLWGWLAIGGGGLFLLCGCCGVPGILLATGTFHWPWSTASSGSASSGSASPTVVTGPRVTLANGDKLKKGMTETQVRAIMGEPTFTNRIGNIKVAAWQERLNVITVSFQNDQAFDRTVDIREGPERGLKNGFQD